MENLSQGQNMCQVYHCYVSISGSTWCPKKVLRLINNKTKTFCSIFKISFVSDWCDINLNFDISLLKIGQILTELQELDDQNAVNHETNELFLLATTWVYMCE